MGFVVLLHLGSALAGPVARDLVSRLAGERHLGAHYGVLASAGGLAVLVGPAGVGALLEPGGVLPWVLLTLLSAASAAGLAVLTRAGLRLPRAGAPVSRDVLGQADAPRP